MKKSIAFLFSVLLLLCSCGNDSTEMPLEEREISIAASFDSGALSRANFASDGGFFWTDGDKIALYTSASSFSSLSISDGQGSKNATFTGTIYGEPSVCAVYPFTAARSLSGSTLKFNAPSIYVYNQDQESYPSYASAYYATTVNSTNMPMIAKIRGVNELSFKHIGGVFCFCINDIPEYTTKITFTANSKICGEFSVDLDEDVPTINTSDTDDPSLKSISVKIRTSYNKFNRAVYFPVPCGTYEGFEISMYDDSGNQTAHLTSTKTKTITRGKAIVFDTFSIDGINVPDNVFDATGTSDGHTYVDLGLSVKWAACNIGAFNPEDSGEYFAWGETDAKSTYSLSQWYGYNFEELLQCGVVDENANLTDNYDVAKAKWGGKWRMPTFDEANQLLSVCTWTWIKKNGLNGYKVTGPSGNSIFLPAAGFGNAEINELVYFDIYGLYWTATATFSDEQSLDIRFRSDFHYGSDRPRNTCAPVRPVTE